MAATEHLYIEYIHHHHTKCVVMRAKGAKIASLAARQFVEKTFHCTPLGLRDSIGSARHLFLQPSLAYSSGKNSGSDKDAHHGSLVHRLTFFIQSLAAAYLFREHVCELTVCVGPSMMPTFNPKGDVAFVEHISVARQTIEVGDVVIAKSVQNPRQVVCKRVLGLPGDRICSSSNRYDVTENRGRVNGGQSWVYGEDDDCVVIPPGHVWLQGDNTMNSTDSRHYGPVPYATLKGRVVCRLYPDPKWV